MEKKTKKVGSAAAAAAAVAGAAAVASAAVMGNDSQEELAMGEPIGEDDDNLIEGGVLPEVVVTGNAADTDDNTLAEEVPMDQPQVERPIASGAVVADTKEDIAEAHIVEEPAHAAQPTHAPVAEPTPAPAAEPAIAVAEPIAPEEEFEDFDDGDVVSTNQPAAKESSFIDDAIDTLSKIGEEVGILPTSDDNATADFVNDAEVDEFLGE